MNEQVAHIVDRVLPRVPYRQWVLTQPGELARVVTFDADLATTVFASRTARASTRMHMRWFPAASSS